MYKYYQLNLFLVLIGKYDPNPYFPALLAYTRSYWSRIRNKHRKDMVLKSWELYYIVSIYNYLQLTLFQVLIGKFDNSQIFSPDWPELDHIRVE